MGDGGDAVWRTCGARLRTHGPPQVRSDNYIWYQTPPQDPPSSSHPLPSARPPAPTGAPTHLLLTALPRLLPPVRLPAPAAVSPCSAGASAGASTGVPMLRRRVLQAHTHDREPNGQCRRPLGTARAPGYRRWSNRPRAGQTTRRNTPPMVINHPRWAEKRLERPQNGINEMKLCPGHRENDQAPRHAQHRLPSAQAS